MPMVQQDLRVLAREQRLLRAVVDVARRCEGRLSTRALDAVLTGAVRPVPPPRRPADR